MNAATAFYASAAVLLVIAGVAKVARPATAAVLMEDLGAPAGGPLSGTRLALAFGVLEVRAVAAVVGLLYAVFALTVLRAMAVGAASCGCFGRVEAPPSWYHVIGNSLFAIAAFVAVSASSPLEVMDSQPAGGVGFVVLVGVLAGLALVVFTALPEAMAARRPAGVTGR